jgi:putative ABC transport system permease protein
VDIMQPLTALLPESTAASRAQTGLLGGFALFALLLSAVGLYGLLSGEVARRTQEFGVRLALGAEPSALLASALRRGMTLLVVGLVLGILAASAASRYLQTLLFEVQPYDVPATLAAAAILVTVGLFACWIPASRAANVDPMIALRHE